MPMPDERTSPPERRYPFGFLTVSAEEKRHLVIRHFNAIAHRYDLLNTLLSFGIHHLWKRAAVRGMGLAPGGRVLDLCGGTGDLSLLAARAVGEGGFVTLCDLNREMMLAGRPRILSSPCAARIALVQGDAERLPFPDAAFDAALVGFGIRNVTHMEWGFREMHRVLKPGGRLMCLEFSRPRSRLFRALYDFYSFRIMPAVGKMFTGSKEAYTYLPESIRTFPSAEALAGTLRELGFTDVSFRLFTNGIAAVHSGVKA